MQKMFPPPLRDKERAIIFRWGVLLVFAASALAPLSGSPSGVNGGQAASTVPRVGFDPLPRFRIPDIQIGADPFVPKAAGLPLGASVRGVIFGTTPRALVEVGKKELLVGVGNVVGGARVVRIDDRGVYLSDGSFIPLRGVQP